MMYDFYLGAPETLRRNERRYLLSVKRMLPRWLNGIPDAEFMAIHQLLEQLAGRAARATRKLVLVETGVGASTIPLAYGALKHGGIAYTWEPNSEKASQIRTVCNETIGPLLGRNINDGWRVVPYDSASPYLGLSVLQELTDHVDYFFHDGEHVWTTIAKELGAIHPLLGDGAVVAIDDAQYDFVHTNEFIVNVIRRRIGLPVATFVGNRCQPFYREVHDYLTARWQHVESVAQRYREHYRHDLFFAYYDAEAEVRHTVNHKRFIDQAHRFEAWQVATRRSQIRHEDDDAPQRRRRSRAVTVGRVAKT
jgi:hypothetical protein